MEIGILTFHRAHNYGAVLQCFALQTFLCNQGHSVRVIDYNNKMLWRYYKWYNPEEMRYAFSNPKKVLQRCIKLIIKWHKRIPRFYAFSRFQSHELNLCPVSDIFQNPFDLILIGSDQVWNTKITRGFDPYYWGQFKRPSHTRVATYAASLKEFWGEKEQPTVYNYLQSLDAVSVREKSLAKAIVTLSPKINPVVVPDPVLLLSAKEWERLAINPRMNIPYVFFYQARDSERVYEVSEKIAERIGKRLIILSANVNGRNSDECRNASPFAFLGWVMNADLIITSSFHVAAFSILFKKQFYCVDLEMGEDNRIKDLLAEVGLEDRFISASDDIDSLCVEEYDCCDSLNAFHRIATHFVTSLF